MRLNKFLAQQTGISRRAADIAITQNRVSINGVTADLGAKVLSNDIVELDGKIVDSIQHAETYIFHKPTGYVCSRDGQGSLTIYDILPPELHALKPVGRLDKDSSGLLLLTNDGELAYQLTHPSFQKKKVYQINLHKLLSHPDEQAISKKGVMLDDGISKLQLSKPDASRRTWTVTMSEGRNRQIRRTFATLGYSLNRLHRTQFGPYNLNDLELGSFRVVSQ